MRSLWVPLTSGVATLCLVTTLWPQLATTAAVKGSLLDSSIDSLLQRLPLVGRISGVSSAWSSTDQALQDLRVGNLSVHRVRFERDDQASPVNGESVESMHDEGTREETIIRSIFGSAWAAAARTSKPSTQTIASVVVTWEDHRIAADLRPDDESLCMGDEDGGKLQDRLASCTSSRTGDVRDETHAKSETSDRQVVYEVQLWVNGWGFDAFWHPANRKISTEDPFVVVSELPQDQELAFRVRMKVKTWTGVLSGFFATEVEGPWSETATLSPVTQHTVDAILMFFAANRALGAVVVFLIGVSVLIILKLVVYAWFGKEAPRKRSGAITVSRDHVEDIFRSGDPGRGRNGSVDLEQELLNLRQELADSEAEVHRLMLFRAYGIESLQANELEELEQELRRSLKLVQKQRRVLSSAASSSSTFESMEETEDEEEDERTDTTVNAIANGGLRTVYEERVEERRIG